MSLESIAALAASALTTPVAASGIAPNGIPSIEAPELSGAAPQAGGAFESLLSGLTQLNGELNAADQGLENIAAGNLDNLHQSMMGMERVRLALQLVLQVRSRALDAYQELMRMQV